MFIESELSEAQKREYGSTSALSSEISAITIHEGVDGFYVSLIMKGSSDSYVHYIGSTLEAAETERSRLTKLIEEASC